MQLKDTLLKCLIDCIVRESARIEKQERYKETFKDSDTGAKGERERGRQIERGTGRKRRRERDIQREREKEWGNRARGG